jgi:hypothetical protein
MRTSLLLVAALFFGCTGFRADPLVTPRDGAADRPLDAPAGDVTDAPVAPDATDASDAADDADVADVATLDSLPVDAGPCGGPCPEGRTCCDNRCIDLTSDPQNCGGCSSSCTAANASAKCQAGRCVPLCLPGFGDCDNSPANGCEVPLFDSVFNCGACSRACSMNHAVPRCDTGRCVVTCDPGWGNCDGDPANGCEVNILTATDNCGGCGTACFAPNRNVVRCESGRCSYTACESGFDDCNRDNSDGCETDVQRDVQRCGACGTTCMPTPGRSPTCVSGVCGTTMTCAAALADCDALPANGCEVNLQTSALHCGRCGGACGTRNATAACVMGRCALSCEPGFADCDGVNGNGCEVDLRASAGHCGACNRACMLTNVSIQQCVMGQCSAAVCAGGTANCDNNAANGCEVNITNSVDHCGGCGRPCRITNGTGRCDLGVCRVAMCSAPFADCNNNPVDGCETNLSNDLRACGACNARCEPPNGSGACLGGMCRIAGCYATFRDCDANAMTGCETNIAANPAHCGACGRACPALFRCVGGNCML